MLRPGPQSISKEFLPSRARTTLEALPSVPMRGVAAGLQLLADETVSTRRRFDKLCHPALEFRKHSCTCYVQAVPNTTNEYVTETR